MAENFGGIPGRLSSMSLDDVKEQSELNFMLVSTMDSRAQTTPTFTSTPPSADNDSFDNSLSPSPDDFVLPPSDSIAHTMRCLGQGLRRVQTCPSELSSLQLLQSAHSQHANELSISQDASSHLLPQEDWFTQTSSLVTSSSSAGDDISVANTRSFGVCPNTNMMSIPAVSSPVAFNTFNMATESNTPLMPIVVSRTINSTAQDTGRTIFNNTARCSMGENSTLNNNTFGTLRRIKSSPIELNKTSIPQQYEHKSSVVSNHARLAKKAEAARLSRRRKKAYIQQLEDRVASLTARLAELERTSGDSSDKTANSHEKEQQTLKEYMSRILAQPSSSNEQLDWVLDRFVSNSRKRQSAVEYFLSQTDECIAPVLQLKFAMWGLGHGAKSAEPEAWSSVMRQQVGLSDEQMKKLREFSEPVNDLRASLSVIQEQLRKLKLAVRSHLTSRHAHLDSLRAMLSPHQVAKLCTWVDSNPLCMQLLQTVWRP